MISLFLLLILFKFNLSTVPSLPFIFFALCLKFSTKSYSTILLWLWREVLLFFRDDAEVFRGNTS